MKLCAVIYRGQIAEVSTVADNHPFGEHGNHYHLEVKVSPGHLCAKVPTLRLVDDGDTAKHVHDPGV